jgi:hypothetical protein
MVLCELEMEPMRVVLLVSQEATADTMVILAKLGSVLTGGALQSLLLQMLGIVPCLTVALRPGTMAIRRTVFMFVVSKINLFDFPIAFGLLAFIVLTISKK